MEEDKQKEFKPTEEHELVLRYLKFWEGTSGKYHMLGESEAGCKQKEIVSIMGSCHGISEQQTKRLIKDLYDNEIIYKAEKNKIRIVANLIELAEYEREFKEIESYGELLEKIGDENYNKFIEIKEEEERKKLLELMNNPKSERDKARVIIEIIKGLSEEHGGRVPISILTEEVSSRYSNISKEKIEQIIIKLKQQGLVFEPVAGYLKAM